MPFIVFQQDTVVHEVGHAVANHGEHPVTGLDAQFGYVRPIPIGARSPDGILVTHHNASRYQPAYLDWIRTTEKPRN